jgi:hypothetical protein
VRGGDGSPNGRDALERTRRGAGAGERIVPVLLRLVVGWGSIVAMSRSQPFRFYL